MTEPTPSLPTLSLPTLSLPALDELAGAWTDRSALAHLPSLRNQWGQGHVNNDLTSLSWVAFPPYSGGYHTGALRIDGQLPAATRLRWSPWGVERAARVGGLSVTTDTRMGYERSRLLWRLTLRNDSAAPVTAAVEQELLAMFAHSEVDWGWLYGTPWTAGHHHDYYTTERLRAETTAQRPRQVQLAPLGPRFVRLGSPRIPGIQRDEDSAPMLLEFELPDHSTPDSGRVRAPGASCTVRGIAVVRADGGTEHVGDAAAEHAVRPDTDRRLDAVELRTGDTFRFDVLVGQAGGSGVVLTHGNHPDSLQVALEDGRLSLRIAGEHETAAEPLPTGVWHTVTVRLDDEAAELSVDGAAALRTTPWWSGRRWNARVDGASVVVEDARSAARSAYSFDTAPTSLAAEGARGTARWDVTLAPGQEVAIGFVLDIADSTGEALAGSRATADGFTAAFDAVADRWRETWQAAFTPGNAEFSGHLPTFHTQDADLSRTYYLGALLAVYMRNTQVSPIGPVFLTGGPRLGPTTTFFWDQSEWARTAALLDPAGVRAWLVASMTVPYDHCHSFDTRNVLPVGNHYAANDHAIFRSVKAYLGVTGDLSLLDETAGDRSVLDHLRAMAYRPRERRAAFGDGVLMDFGRDAWELLECVPNYRDGVVSLNAGHVGMLRSLAALLRVLDPDGGNELEAKAAQADADELAHAVLGQYAGGGRWNIAHPEGDEVIGHCLDFELVVADMGEDLPERHRAEMADFVTGHLIDGDWMRALDPEDPIAPLSDRPDHGAGGAFAAWPGATAFGLCRLGRHEDAAGLLRRAHRATSGALWGQAMEVTADGGYRVAERGVANRDSNAAVAVTETVLAGLFGIEAGIESLGRRVGRVETPFGRLTNVRAVGFSLPVRES
ncbi:laminin G domain-containing protein [Streptomyces avicenniae]|uniref:laminin G domain-containing protein n=1 Tax=Streptomyces avicenniae TaxID=500153 RepID=UPI00069BF4B9|nr:laminin G domain-containing protein [Streptomyces avicenniae]